MSTRVLVTGSRRWRDRTLVLEVLSAVEARLSEVPTLVHGAQGELDEEGAWVEGLDQLAAEIAAGLGWEVESHPADWDAWGNAAGPIRNQEMVDLGADVCLAFPLEGSRGTWDTVRKAGMAGIPVVLVDETRSWRSRLAHLSLN